MGQANPSNYNMCIDKFMQELFLTISIDKISDKNLNTCTGCPIIIACSVHLGYYSRSGNNYETTRIYVALAMTLVRGLPVAVLAPPKLAPK